MSKGQDGPIVPKVEIGRKYKRDKSRCRLRQTNLDKRLRRLVQVKGRDMSVGSKVEIG